VFQPSALCRHSKFSCTPNQHNHGRNQRSTQPATSSRRTEYEQKGGQPRQLIGRDQPLSIYMTAYPDAGGLHIFRQQSAAHAGAKFDAEEKRARNAGQRKACMPLAVSFILVVGFCCGRCRRQRGRGATAARSMVHGGETPLTRRTAPQTRKKRMSYCKCRVNLKVLILFL
jgi:hypothetical protein